jgi:hypothetical protein
MLGQVGSRSADDVLGSVPGLARGCRLVGRQAGEDRGEVDLIKQV